MDKKNTRTEHILYSIRGDYPSGITYNQEIQLRGTDYSVKISDEVVLGSKTLNIALTSCKTYTELLEALITTGMRISHCDSSDYDGFIQQLEDKEKLLGATPEAAEDRQKRKKFLSQFFNKNQTGNSQLEDNPGTAQERQVFGRQGPS